MKNIAIAGSIIVDKLNAISVYPQKGKLVDILSISRAVGGCVPNVAVDIKRLDSSFNVFAVGRIGDDGEGNFVLNTLNEEGIDVSFVKKGEMTSFTDVMSVVGGERTFFTFAGESKNFGFDDIDFDALKVDMFHLGYFLLLEKIDNGDGIKILKELKERNIKTSIDLVSKENGDYLAIRPALKYTDNLIINEIEAQGIAGFNSDNLEEVAKAVKDYGVSERVIIHCPDFACCLSNDGFTIVPSFELPKDYIKGTTGAGDAFCAGSLIGIAKGYSDKEILEFASMASVCNLSKEDSISGMCDFETAKKICAKFKRKSL